MTDDILSVICKFTDVITYGSPVGEMLNCTERITNKIKRVIFFWCVFSICKPSVNLLTTDSPTNQKLPTNIFLTDNVQHDPVRKIITDGLLV